MDNQKRVFCTFHKYDEGDNTIEFHAITNDLQDLREAIKNRNEAPEGSSSPSATLLESTDDLEPKSIYEEHINKFVQRIYSYYDVLYLFTDVFPTMPRALYKRFVVEYAEKNFEKIEEHDGFPIYRIDATESFRITSNLERVQRNESGTENARAAILLSLIATYDAVFSDFCKFLLKQNPERYDGTERTFKLKDLLSLDSLDEIIDRVVDDEVHQLMNRSHADQISFFEKNFHVKFSDKYPRWAEFMEIFERRNLAAHGDLIVNKIYLSNCSQHGGSDCPSVGTVLKITRDYMENSLDLLLDVFINMAFSTWRKRAPNEADKAFSMIVATSFDMLRHERYKLALRITENALHIKDSACEKITESMLVINNAIGHKCLGDEASCEQRLKSVDWSATTPLLKLGVASLRSDAKEASKYIEPAKLVDHLSLVDLREWPVFRWVRSDIDFQEAVARCYGEPLQKSSASKSEDQASLENLEASV